MSSMPTNRTLAIIKPDAIASGKAGDRLLVVRHDLANPPGSGIGQPHHLGSRAQSGHFHLLARQIGPITI